VGVVMLERAGRESTEEVSEITRGVLLRAVAYQGSLCNTHHCGAATVLEGLICSRAMEGRGCSGGWEVEKWGG
jgi:hypothetical protein